MFQRLHSTGDEVSSFYTKFKSEFKKLSVKIRLGVLSGGSKQTSTI